MYNNQRAQIPKNYFCASVIRYDNYGVMTQISITFNAVIYLWAMLFEKPAQYICEKVSTKVILHRLSLPENFSMLVSFFHDKGTYCLTILLVVITENI